MANEGTEGLAPVEQESVQSTAPVQLSDESSSPSRKDAVLLLCLFAIQAFCFLPICFKSGFYLDDWLTFWNLHFRPHSIIELIKGSFSDPRMVTRPVQCLYYGVTYFLFGDRPLPYHLLRFSLEFAGAAFLYLAIKKMTSNRLLAALTAAIFVLYPNHDSTHYWIGAGLGPGFGLTLYLASLYFLTAWVSKQTKRAPMLLIAALVFFALSAFCYESFLPMLSLSFAAIVLTSLSQMDSSQRKNGLGSVFKKAALAIAPFLLVGICEPIYQRVLLPRISHTFLSPSTFDLNYFFSVFANGLAVSIGPRFWKFCWDRAFAACISLEPASVVWMILTILSCAFLVFLSCKAQQSEAKSDDAKAYSTVLFIPNLLTCAVVFLCSYLTFAVAQGYMPVLDTIINRVNIGGSVALSFAIANILLAISRSTKVELKTAQIAALCALSLPLFALFALCDLGMSAFWTCSWEVQKNTRFLIQKSASKIQSGDSILLAHIHRYLMWAPVFDGTWDFQSMLRMTLNRNDVQGGVVCDRLSIQKDKIVDNSVGYVCAEYPSSRTTILVPSGELWIKLNSSKDFVDAVEAHKNEMLLEKGTLERWRAELSK